MSQLIGIKWRIIAENKSAHSNRALSPVPDTEQKLAYMKSVVSFRVTSFPCKSFWVSFKNDNTFLNSARK